MKSLLNDINRLEKGYELLERIVKAQLSIVAHLQVDTPESDVLAAQRHLHNEIRVARAFIEKYEEKG